MNNSLEQPVMSITLLQDLVIIFNLKIKNTIPNN